MAAYYPELGEKAPACALFKGDCAGSGLFIEWAESNADVALATLQRLKIRPRMTHQSNVAQITPAAHTKLRQAGLLTTELML